MTENELEINIEENITYKNQLEDTEQEKPKKEIKKEFKEELKETKETTKEFKTTMQKDIPDYFREGLFKVSRSSLKTILTYLFLEIALVLLNVVNIFLIRNFLVKVIILSISIFVFIVIFIVILIRLFIFHDWDKIGQKIILLRGDFITALFFSNDKRLIKRYVVPTADRRSFYVGGLLYTIDMSSIYTDEYGNPLSFYVVGIPNPLKFDFLKYLDMYFKNVKDNNSDANINQKLDIRYSSETLVLMKNDKLMSDMHKDRSQEINKMIMWFLIIIGFLVFVIMIIALVLGNKSPVVNIIQNATRVMG